MSGYVEYDEQDFHEEETPAQLAARRTRRRRRHGKKQGSTDGYRPSEDYRGRWMPPPSATALTLAQLGIHVAPPPQKDGQASLTLAKLGLHIDPPTMPSKPMLESASRNVVTWSDLNLVDSIVSRSPGAQDHYQPTPPPRPLQRPQPWLNGATSPFHCEEQPCDRILSVPSPQMSLHLAEQVHGYPTDQLPPVFAAPRPSQHLPIQPIQSQPATWSESDPGLRHWLCSGQYGAQPIFNSPLGSNSGMALASAPLAPAPGWAGVATPSMPAPTSPMAKAPTSPMGKVPTSPIAKEVAKKIAEQDKLEAEKQKAVKLEGEKLETLLENLAAEAYQD